MHALLASFSAIALSEMGDKTQLLAFSLATRFRRPWLVMAGILVATVINHALVAWFGAWGGAQVSARTLSLVLGFVFLAFGIWALFPDSLDETPSAPGEQRPWQVVTTTATLFFLAEMGDKTQFATLALGARYAAPLLVTIGTTLGMLATDGLAVVLGDRLGHRLPLAWLRRASAAMFLIFSAVSFQQAL